MKIFKLLILVSIPFISNAQIDGSLLLGLRNATTQEMTTVSNPIEGSLIYNTTDSRTYQFNGTNWDKISISPTTVSAKTADYTLTINDNESILTFDSATDITLTIPGNLPIGFNISVYQIGTGKVLLYGASGVTIKNRLSRFKTAGIDAGIGLISTATNIFHASGDLKK